MIKNSKKGVTLVELVVAMALTSIFAVLCVALINPIERTYRSTLKLARAQLLADTLVDSIRNECDDVKHDEKASVWIGKLSKDSDDSELLSKGPEIKVSKGNVLVFQRNNNYTEAIYSFAGISDTNFTNVANNTLTPDNTAHSIVALDNDAKESNLKSGIVHFGYYQAKEDDRGVFPINSYDYTNPVLASTYGEFTVDLSFSELTMSKSGKYPIYVICTVKVLDKGSVFYTRSAVLCFSANGSGNGNGGSYKPVTDKNISVTIRWLNINDEVVAWPSSVPSVSVILTDDGIVKGQYNAIRDQRKFVFASVKVKGNVAVTSEDVTGYEYVVTGNADKGFVITYKIAKNDTVKLVSGRTFFNIMGKDVSYVIFDSFANHPEFAKGTGSKVAININQINNDNNRRSDYELFKSTDGDGKVTAYILSDDGTFIANENCESMFNGCTKLENITGLTGVDTYRTTNMKAMFKNCKIMKQFYLPGFVKAACRTTESMFENCYSVTSVNLSGWDTSNVTTMMNMFFHFHCYINAESLGTLEPMTVDLSDFDFGNCTTLENFFGVRKGELYTDVYDPCNITRIKLPVNADCTKVTTMKFMFKGVNGLNKIDNLETMKTSGSLVSTWAMFSRVNIEEIDISSMVLSSVTDAQYMFDRNYELKCVVINGKRSDEAGFVLSMPVCTTVNSIFERCYKLNKFKGELNLPACKDFVKAFSECTSLKTFDGKLNLKECLDINNAFNSCTQLDEFNLSEYDLSKCKIANNLFSNCTSLKKLVINGKSSDSLSAVLEFDLPECTNASNMFRGDTKIDTFSGKLIFPKCASFYDVFNGCSNLEYLNLSGSDFRTCNNFSNTFKDCNKLSTIKMNDINLDSATGLGFVSLNSVKILELSGAKLHSLTSLKEWYKSRNLEELDFSNVTLDSCTTTESMLLSCLKLKKVNMKGFKTPVCTTMDYMFDTCNSVEEIDLSDWDTSNVVSMKRMFYNFHRGFANNNNGTKSELVLDLSSFDLTDNLKYMTEMFGAGDDNNLIRNITGIVLPANADTDHVEDMSGVFNNCTGLKTITNLNKLSGSSNKSARSLFRRCYELASIDLSAGFVSSACTSCAGMFESCYSVENGDFIKEWDTSNVQAMDWMFYMFHAYYNSQGTQNVLAELDVSGLDFSSCTTMEKMFASIENNNVIRKITTIRFKKGSDMSKVKTLKSMFVFCKGVENIVGLNGADLRSATTVEMMFSNCTELTSLDLSEINLMSCTNTNNLFNNCANMLKVYLSKANLRSLTSIGFIGKLTNVRELYFDEADLSGLTTLENSFSGRKTLEIVNFSDVKLGDCTTAERMFLNCTNLKEIYINGFKAPEKLNYMFENCNAVEVFESKRWDTSRTTQMINMFYHFCVRWNNGTGVASDKWLVIDLSSFDFRNVTTFNCFMGIAKYNDGDSHITKVILPDTAERCDASKATDLHYMFRCCENLTEVENLGLFKAKPTGSCCAIFSRVAMEEIDVRSIDFTSSNNKTWMFDANKKLKKVIFSAVNQGLTLPANCFDGCGPVTREYV